MILAIDANDWVHRYYPHKEAETVPAVIRAIHTAAQHYHYRRVAVAFDWGGGKYWRHDLFPGYKPDREDKPLIRVELVKLMAACPGEGLEVYQVEKQEADDILASLARQTNDKITIASRDKDLCQCLEKSRVNIASKFSTDREASFGVFMTEELCREKFGIGPEYWTTYQALVGDKVDGISGAKGIGPKKAVELIRAFGPLDAIIEKPIDDLPLSASVVLDWFEWRDSGQWEIDWKLVTLNTDLELS